MAGYTTDKDGNIINAGGIDVGFLAGTQSQLLTDGLDTEEEILDWYASYGQGAGIPANYNEKLARDAGFQENFVGNGTWENKVQPFFAGEGDNLGNAPAMVLVDGVYTLRGGSMDSYGDSDVAPDSEVWLGPDALKDGWIYKQVAGPDAVISTNAGVPVLTSDEIMWDPDVYGGAATSGYHDHRMVTETRDNVRTADSNFDVNQTVSWQTFKDAPHNVFSNFDEFVRKRLSAGDWDGENYTPAERRALDQGQHFGLGWDALLRGTSKKMGGYEMTADEWAEDVEPRLAAAAANIPRGGADPGYFMGGSGANLPGRRVLDAGAFPDIPFMDQFATTNIHNISYRQKANAGLGRADMNLTPADSQAYQDLLQSRSFGGSSGPSLTAEQRRLGRRDWMEDEDEPEPGGGPVTEPVRDRNPAMSIFTNSSVGFPDPDLFQFR